MLELQLNKESHDIFLTAYKETGKKYISRFANTDVKNRAGQRVLCMLKTEEGEAFTNENYGVPWFGKILGLSINHLDVATKILRDKVRALPCVQRVSSVNLELKKGERNVSGSVSFVATDGSEDSETF